LTVGTGEGITGGVPLRTVIITPNNQWDVSFAAAMTVLDLGAWNDARASRASREAQRQRVAATTLEVQKTVARTYYQLIGASAVARAARRCRRLSRQTVRR
jgi:outer membrane protein TolC